MHRHPRLAVFAVFAAAFTPLAAQEAASPQTQDVELTLELVVLRRALQPQLPPVAWIPGTTTIATAQPADPAQPDGAKVAVTLDASAVHGWTVRFSSVDLNAALTAAGAEDLKPEQMPPFGWVDGDHLRIVLLDAVYHWKLGADRAERVLLPPADATAAAIADGDRIGAWVTDRDILVVRRDGRRRRITWDGSADIVYGGAAHRAEFGIQDGLWWDPTGRYLAFSREDLRPVDAYPYADFGAHPPAPLHGRYPMAGRTHSIVTIGIYDSEDDSVRFLANDPALDLYWTNVTFAPDDAHVFVALVSRGQDQMKLVRFDANTGEVDAELFTEADAEWVEPEHGPIFVPDGQGSFLWFSPRDGYRHLYLYDAGGTCVRQVTAGAFDVRAFLGFGSDGRGYVMASGDNPLEMHLWAADLDGGALSQITVARGWHRCQLSPDGSRALDQYSNLELPGALDLLATKTGRPLRLFTADDPLAGYRVGKRQFFSVQADDGTPLHGLLLTPPDADATRKHPVLQYVYGGPHSQLVRDTWLGGAHAWLHYMAARGFVVCVLDNRGTDNRGIEFSQAVFRRLGTLEVADQARAVQHVLELPFTDPDRVGVHGWSYGGFMTLSLMLRRPDLYTCGISGAPVTDWSQYETGYTERYMDTPGENPEGYEQADVVHRVADLAGRLMVVQGTDDKTVMWSHSMRFLAAAIEQKKLVEFMAYPMQKHGLVGADREHFYRLMTRFFVERLRP